MPEKRHEEIGGEVVEAAAAGDHGAFTAIVRHYHPRLRGLAAQLMRDRQLVDDALQDVYLQAYRGLPAFRGDAALGTWLYRITYNVCMSQARQRQSERVDVDPDTLAGHRDRPERLAVQVNDLAAALADLPPDQRAVVLLVYREGFSYDEVAEIVGVPRGTIASRLWHAREALRHSLAWEPGGRQSGEEQS